MQHPATKKKKMMSFGECLKAPFRVLGRLRDMYVKSLGGCAGAGGGSRGGGYTAGVVALMPRARSRSAFGPSNRFGSAEPEDDFGNLVRIRSAASKAVILVPRSQSAPAIERIEEEGEDQKEEDEDEDEKEDAEAYQRSQSCAVPSAAAAGRLTVRRPAVVVVVVEARKDR